MKKLTPFPFFKRQGVIVSKSVVSFLSEGIAREVHEEALLCQMMTVPPLLLHQTAAFLKHEHKAG
jgi:hypothetical protein